MWCNQRNLNVCLHALKQPGTLWSILAGGEHWAGKLCCFQSRSGGFNQDSRQRAQSVRRHSLYIPNGQNNRKTRDGWHCHWLSRFGIRCNCVLPGFILTPMTDKVPEKVISKVRRTQGSEKVLDCSLTSQLLEDRFKWTFKNLFLVSTWMDYSVNRLIIINLNKLHLKKNKKHFQWISA